MSEFADDVIARYVDLQPGLREALLHDPMQTAQIESLRQTLTMVERALADEGVPDEVRRRVINRTVWGDPEGPAGVHARMMEMRKHVLASDLPPDIAKAWWELSDAGPVRPDEEPTT
jgi:hypothetical protein